MICTVVHAYTHKYVHTHTHMQSCTYIHMHAVYKAHKQSPTVWLPPQSTALQAQAVAQGGPTLRLACATVEYVWWWWWWWCVCVLGGGVLRVIYTALGRESRGRQNPNQGHRERCGVGEAVGEAAKQTRDATLLPPPSPPNDTHTHARATPLTLRPVSPPPNHPLCCVSAAPPAPAARPSTAA